MLFSVASIPAQVFADSGKMGLTGSATAGGAKYSLSGDFSFTVGSNGRITGSGSGNAFVDWQAEAQGTGIMCTAKESHDVSLSITGKYNSETGLARFQISSSPTTFPLKMNCPGIEFLSGNRYDVPNPFNMAGNYLEMPLQTGASGSKTFSISQGSATLSGTMGSAGIQSTSGSSSSGEFSSGGSSFGFAFDIDVPTFANVIQGETIDVKVIIKYIRGEGTVGLSATNFIQFNVFSSFSPSGVSLPSSKTANLEVTTTCHTIPDTYRITVRGTSGFSTSVDTITVNVFPNKACGSMAITAADIKLVNKYLEISVTYFNRGEYEKAIIELDKVIKLSPGNWVAYSTKGWALYQLGDDQGAAKNCGVALKSKPQDFSTLKCLGFANEKLGLTSQARSFYELALQISPHDSVVTRHLTELEDIEVPDDLRDSLNTQTQDTGGLEIATDVKIPVDLSDMHPKISDRFKTINDIFKKHTGENGKITSGRDSDKHLETSKHYWGQAIDLRTKGLDPDQITKILKDLRAALEKYNIYVGDETKTSEPHIHIQYPPKGVFAEDSRIPPISEVTMPGQMMDTELQTLPTRAKVPVWIKNNAKWWSEGTIGDSDFTNGIQYMIKEKIINIPDLPKTVDSVPSFDVEISGPTAVKEKVPGWIKNNAEWWANGLIGEDDFVNGIKYLVEKGIIQV